MAQPQTSDAFLELAQGALREAPRRASELVDEACPRLLRFVAYRLSVLGLDAKDREDCVQDVMSRVWRYRMGYKGDTVEELSGWLSVLCRSVTTDHKRRKGVRSVHTSMDVTAELPAGEGSGRVVDIEERELFAVVGDCLASLPDQQGLVLRLHYFEPELSTSAIAAILECTPTNVRRIRRKALESLQRCLVARRVV